MLTPQYLLPIHTELVIDLFAGGGGASTGIEQAIGRAVDIAINHDAEAVSLHQANHPQTQHHLSDVFEVDPLAVCDGRPLTKTAQVRMCGNSVCPPLAQAIVGANFSDFGSIRRVA